jgi:FkbM family methyltransferase
VKLKHWLRYLLAHDTTWEGEFAVLASLLLNREGIPKVVVDVGANDGFYSSNSYPFIRRGWRGLLIEPHPAAFASAARLHAGNERVAVLNIACGKKPEKVPLVLFTGDAGGSLSVLCTSDSRPAGRTVLEHHLVEVEPLADVLERQRVPETFGLLSVDTEGHDYQVIEGLELARFRPCVIMTEDGPNNAEKFELLRGHGYRLHTTIEANTIWSRLSEAT